MMTIFGGSFSRHLQWDLTASQLTTEQNHIQSRGFIQSFCKNSYVRDTLLKAGLHYVVQQRKKTGTKHCALMVDRSIQMALESSCRAAAITLPDPYNRLAR